MITGLTIGYLLMGIATILWFLHDISNVEKRAEEGESTPSDLRVLGIPPGRFAALLVGLLLLWWAAIIYYILAGNDNDEDNPQDNVPPEYR